MQREIKFFMFAIVVLITTIIANTFIDSTGRFTMGVIAGVLLEAILYKNK